MSPVHAVIAKVVAYWKSNTHASCSQSLQRPHCIHDSRYFQFSSHPSTHRNCHPGLTSWSGRLFPAVLRAFDLIWWFSRFDLLLLSTASVSLLNFTLSTAFSYFCFDTFFNHCRFLWGDAVKTVASMVLPLLFLDPLGRRGSGLMSYTVLSGKNLIRFPRAIHVVGFDDTRLVTPSNCSRRHDE